MRSSFLVQCLALAAFLTTSVAESIVPRKNSKVPRGFVTTNGREFELDGKPFAFVGANSYWLPHLTSQDDIELTFKSLKSAGVKVLRTWGWNALNATELPGALESGLTYYQVWNSTKWALNAGPQGLKRLDNVIATAAKHDIKVILTFTNNWVGYGGSDLFIQWIVGAGQTHDVFYTDKRVIASYQSYVKTIVERYKHSSTIFAWELINEARCLSDTLPAGPACVPGSNTLNTWYGEQSNFVRSLDPNHMITTGGEGHFYWTDPEKYGYDESLVNDYNYNGQAGEDFDNDLLLPNIDFGTYHLYPQTWYSSQDHPGTNFSAVNWGLQWIDQHVQSANRANKPVVIEEFGLTGLNNKTTGYPTWVQRALDTKHGGIMPWQWGQLGLTEDGGNRAIKYADAIIDGASPNDGFTFYANQTAVWDIFTKAAKIQNARSV